MPNLRICSIDGCNKKHFARSWCLNHYQLWRKWDTPHGCPRKSRMVKCGWCASEFKVFASRKNKFCSKVCLTAHRAASKKAYTPVVKPCSTCGTAFNPRAGGKFCSDECRIANPDKSPRKGPLQENALDLIKAEISYDPETGIIRRLSTGRPVTTTIPKGYILVGVINRRMYGHRLAWALHYGEWPAEQVDHINGNKTDNRIINLRHVSHSENLYNSKVKVTSKSGIKGVRQMPHGRYSATVGFKNKLIHIGTFDTAKEAEQARIAKEIELGISHFVRPTGKVVGT